MLVYDITQEKTFDNIAKWLRNIEEVGKRVVTTSTTDVGIINLNYDYEVNTVN